ncbi:MAG: TolC family protein [Opitutaceae bacterium]|nr:TolC family protein [Opitutaceae bacterium]
MATLPWSGPCAAAQDSTENKAEFLRALATAPALNASVHRTDAARERLGAAGRLADIEVEGMASRMVGPMNERSTMWEVNVMQPLPRRGERSADRDRARADVSMARSDHAMLAGELAAEVAGAIAEAEGSLARLRLQEAQLERLNAVLRSVEARIATGSGRLSDRLTVQARLASMGLMAEEERRNAADALSDVRGRLGWRPEAALPAFAAPLPAEISIDEAAAVRFAAARGAEAQARVRMAHASANPMTSVGVRFEQERRSMGNDNTLGVALTTDLPFRSRGYARADARAAEAERSAALADADAVRHRIDAALRKVERAEHLAGIARRLSRETVDRLEAEYESLLRAASTGSGQASTVLEVVELLEKTMEAEIQIIRADTAVRTARAELWRYYPTADLIIPQP